LYLIQPGEVHGGRADPHDPYTTFIAGFDPAALPLSQTNTNRLRAFPTPAAQPNALSQRWTDGVLVMNAPMRDVSQAAEQVRVLDNALGAKAQRVLHGADGAQEIFRRLLTELDRPDDTPAARSLKVLMVQVLLVELLVYIARLRFEQLGHGMNATATELGAKRADIQEVVAWLQERICQPPSLPEMAACAGLSPAHFSVVFKQETGQTPLEWMTALRVEEAARRLRAQPAVSVTQIALNIGFSSSQYFSLVFRKHKGCTPKEWRNRYLQKVADDEG
jgi:AraC-like DNA-binding protein